MTTPGENCYQYSADLRMRTARDRPVVSLGSRLTARTAPMSGLIWQGYA
jgi:hypothetical protein